MFGVTILQNHRQHVHLQVVHNLTLKTSFLTVVYASCIVAEHRNLWADIRSHAQSSTSWIVMGDFNALITGDERIGDNTPEPVSMAKFNQCLIDYHCPLLVDFWMTEGAPRGSFCFHNMFDFRMTEGAPRGSFCFHNMWLKSDTLFNVVEKSWSVPLFGDLFFVLTTKLRAFNICLKKWNREVVGNVFTMVESAEGKVIIWQGIFETSGLAVDRENLGKAKVEHLRYLAMDEDYWKQKSGVKVVFAGLKRVKTLIDGYWGNVLLKLDMTKAFDMLSWDFLKLVLRKFGFTDAWIDRIMSFHTTHSRIWKRLVAIRETAEEHLHWQLGCATCNIWIGGWTFSGSTGGDPPTPCCFWCRRCSDVEAL
ncbi:hypothetical protein LIER_18921 [Lithospermum erythrorhizon]|uniref:Reverse transcriptase domain-containing protein n=1 Tax=Lithospermum erythrorhizon TaxID=34254 RepID=A0AAV3QI55_LITER